MYLRKPPVQTSTFSTLSTSTLRGHFHRYIHRIGNFAAIEHLKGKFAIFTRCLGATPSDADFARFVQRYATHLVVSAELGGKLDHYMTVERSVTTSDELLNNWNNEFAATFHKDMPDGEYPMTFTASGGKLTSPDPPPPTAVAGIFLRQKNWPCCVVRRSMIFGIMSPVLLIVI